MPGGAMIVPLVNGQSAVDPEPDPVIRYRGKLIGTGLPGTNKSSPFFRKGIGIVWILYPRT